MKIKTISKTIVGDNYFTIDKEINEFIENKEVIDIKINQHLVMGSGNRVTYVIMYK